MKIWRGIALEMFIQKYNRIIILVLLDNYIFTYNCKSRFIIYLIIFKYN